MFAMSDSWVMIFALSWLRDMTDQTQLPDQPLFAVHNVHEVTGKETLASDFSYHRQAVMGGKQKIKHASLSVMRRPRRDIGYRPLRHAT